MLLPALLLAVTPPAVAAPNPPAVIVPPIMTAPLEDPGPRRTYVSPTPEEEIWARALKADNEAGYFLYLRRYPNGANADKALRRIGVSVRQRYPAYPATAQAQRSAREECVALVEGFDRSRAVVRYGAARTTDDYRRYLDAFPDGPCTALAATQVAGSEFEDAHESAQPIFAAISAHRTSNAAFVLSEDYPSLMLRQGASGLTSIRMDIGINGRLTGCTLTHSSGWEMLDQVACRLAERRLRYDPARGQDGAPVPATDYATIRWEIP